MRFSKIPSAPPPYAGPANRPDTGLAAAAAAAPPPTRTPAAGPAQAPPRVRPPCSLGEIPRRLKLFPNTGNHPLAWIACLLNRSSNAHLDPRTSITMVATRAISCHAIL